MIMMDKGYSCPRRDAFPAGLRVLVVDDDPTWLKILEKMLKKCSFEVTTCGLAREALSLLRERKDGYDIVISDVNMPDMDGFKLLEHVGLEMDLPVISKLSTPVPFPYYPDSLLLTGHVYTITVMSVDGETSRVMKGVQHGACDYLLKPIRMKELRNIWQHVIRKKLNEVRDIESIDSIEIIRMTRNGADHFDDCHSLCGDEFTTLRKRKDHRNKHDENDLTDSSTMKKARVIWTVDLHQKFVDAVNQIGFDKVGPKKILELMNVPWLTRENVASHLQKYRLYLDRLQKENGQKSSFGEMKHSESSSKDFSGSLSHQKLVEILQSDITNGTARYSNNDVNIHNIDPRIQEDDMKGSISISKEEPSRSLIASVSDRQALMADVPSPCNRTGVQRDFDNTFASLEPEVDYSLFDSAMPTSYTWSDVKDIPCEQDSKPLVQQDYGFSQLPFGLKHQIQVELPQAAVSISSAPSTAESEVPDANENQPLYGPQHQIQVDVPPASVPGNSAPSTTERELCSALKNQHELGDNHISPTEIVNESFPMLSKSHITSYPSFYPFSPSMLDLKNQGFSLNSFPDFEQEKNSVVCESALPVALQEELELCWLPNDYSAAGSGLEKIEVPWYSDPRPMAEPPINFCDALRYDSEYPAEFSMIGQSLFA